MLHIQEIAPTRKAMRAFVRFPLTLYRNDPHYVQPLVEQQVRALLGRRNALVSNGVQCFLMAYDGDRPVGRLLAGIDFRLIQRLGRRQGYISLFECIDDQAAANALFDAAKTFLKLNGITSVVGPSPAAFDDFGRGLLLDGGGAPPTVLSPYNPPYYARLFEGYGFSRHSDCFAYDLPLERMADSRYDDVLRRAQQRFGYHVEHVDVRRDLKRYARTFARIIAESVPSDWEGMPPTAERLYYEFKNIRSLLWPDYLIIAQAGQRPIGFLAALPDYNALLRRVRRHLPPFRWLALAGRPHVERLRAVMEYVVPEYQNKGVEVSMVALAAEAARRNGVSSVEGSMIDEQNLKGRLTMEKLGGTVCRVYRQYRLNL